LWLAVLAFEGWLYTYLETLVLTGYSTPENVSKLLGYYGKFDFLCVLCFH
ncbi:MAG: hypothetical protein QG620_859, partial [Patescibacteria group bacterium]|nr:hypothetical protein [Patescibacteria group bacterium]